MKLELSSSRNLTYEDGRKEVLESSMKLELSSSRNRTTLFVTVWHSDSSMKLELSSSRNFIRAQEVTESNVLNEA